MPAAAQRRRWRAPAKVNLTLHVLGRREDGYHELDSIVAFAGACDWLDFEPGPRLSLGVAGPTAGLAGPDEDNLVLRAARALAERVEGLSLGRFRLVKTLPVAAGLGGGSSDAAAALRALAFANELDLADPRVKAAAEATGADVPVCLEPVARFMRGAGERVAPPLGLAPLAALLVNPGVATPTPRVFQGLGLERGARAPYGGACAFDARAPLQSLAAGRNDLQRPAIAVAPDIETTLAQLRAGEPARVVRMSGSGATCFALFDDRRAAVRAARALRRARPDWWVRATYLR